MNGDFDAQDVQAYVDGELDLARQLAFEQALEREPPLRAGVATIQDLRRRIREEGTYHAAPLALRHRIARSGASDAGSARPGVSPGTSGVGPGEALRRWFAWRPLSVGLAIAFVVAFGIESYQARQRRDDRLTADIVASHVRSTFGEHLVDVASSDHHTVKPWLSSKLGFSPPVRDAQLGGAVFLGGRIDYVEGRPVAALVYRQGEHVVNAFVWPGDAGRGAIDFATQRGYQIAHWSRDGMTHWVVSDVNRAEFMEFVDRLAAPDSASPTAGPRGPDVR